MALDQLRKSVVCILVEVPCIARVIKQVVLQECSSDGEALVLVRLIHI